MLKARIEHEFECDQETFWRRIFFDEAFNRRLFLEHLGFSRWTLVSQDERDDAIVRVVEVIPAVGDLPAPLKALVGEGLGYRERGRFDRRTRRYQVEAIPSRLAERLSISGFIECGAAGNQRCCRVFDVEIAAKVFGLGTTLERRILSDLQRSYDQSANFIRRELATGSLAAC